MDAKTRELLDRAKVLAAAYRDAVANLVAIIGEIDRLRVYGEAGYGSTFELCVAELHLSEDDAYKLIRSARAARERPEVLSFLAEGSLTTRAVAILAPSQKDPDFIDLLERAKNRSIREVEQLAIERHPLPVPRDSIRLIRVDAAAADQAPVGTYEVRFTVNSSMKRLIDRLKDMLSNKFPAGDLEDLFREAVDYYLEREDPLRATPAERRSTRNPRAREVPPAIRDEVWRRDDGRCTFVSEDGRRCQTTKWLELDHVIPWALGGRSDDAGNIRLLCRTHNQQEARRIFRLVG